MKVDEALTMLEEGVKSVFTSENYQNYLRVMSRFTDYSASNCILIFSQMPTATHVAGYRDWQNKFGRQVKKGARGIRIIAPMMVKEKNGKSHENSNVNNHPASSGNESEKEKKKLRFRVATVFDVSMTEGKPLPTFGVDELTGSVENFERFMQVLTLTTPVPIRYEDIQSGAKGYYSRTSKEIVIKAGMSETQTFKTCLHEISHFLLHDNDNTKDQQTREVEAESVASVVCSFFNIRTNDYSWPYIASWSSGKDLKELKTSLDTIRKTSKQIIVTIKKEMENKDGGKIQFGNGQEPDSDARERAGI